MNTLLKNISLKGTFKIEKENLGQVFGLSLIIYSILAVTVLLFAFGRYERVHERERMYSDGITLANLITRFAASNLTPAKRMDLLRIIDFVKREKGLAYCIISDAAGQTIADIGSNSMENTTPDHIRNNALCSDYPLRQEYQSLQDGTTIYEFSKPIFTQGTRTGIVRLGIIPDTGFVISQSARSYISPALLIIFFFIPVFYYLFRHSLRPFKMLQKRLEEVMRGGDLRELPVAQNGELGTIAAQVHKIIKAFKTRSDTVLSSKKELEIANRVIAYEKKRIETVLDHLSEGVIALNSSGQVLYVNKSMENILDVSRDQMIGQAADTGIPNEIVVSFINESRREWQRSKDRKEFACSHLVGTYDLPGKGAFRLVFSQLANAEGDNAGELLVLSDVTSQTMAEQARGEFLAHVAHELRSPLSTIKSYTELLMDGDVQDLETQKEFYNVITMETDRLAKLIEDLLNISKIEMGSLSLKKGLVKPVNLLDSCVAAVMSQAVSKKIQIEKLYPDSLSPLDVDKDLMGVAIHNIFSNALKYTTEGGKISVQAEEEPEHTLLHIRDTGCGMSEEDLQHIFEKFYRSDDEQVQQQKGTGLGLALTREIITLHGGTIQVESTVGEGSCFSITLPKETNFERMF